MQWAAAIVHTVLSLAPPPLFLTALQEVVISFPMEGPKLPS